MTEHQQQNIIRLLKPESSQKVFFTTIMYGLPYHIANPEEKKMITLNDEVLLVCGIANPTPIKELLLQQAATYYQKNYKFILTTEKDAVRLAKFSEELKELPMYVLPIKHEFLFGEANIFDELIISFISNFNKEKA